MAPGKHWADQTFGPKLCTSDGRCSKPSEMLKDKELVGVFFSAQWCGYCVRFTPVLEAFYNIVRFHNKNKLEIVYVNSGDNMDNFEASTRSSPWLHVPLSAAQQLGYIQRSIRQATGGTNGELASRFSVQALPTLVLLRGQDGKMLKQNARSDVANAVHPSEVLSDWEEGALRLREAEYNHKMFLSAVGVGGLLLTGLLGSFILNKSNGHGKR